MAVITKKDEKIAVFDFGGALRADFFGTDPLRSPVVRLYCGYRASRSGIGVKRHYRSRAFIAASDGPAVGFPWPDGLPDLIGLVGFEPRKQRIPSRACGALTAPPPFAIPDFIVEILDAAYT